MNYSVENIIVEKKIVAKIFRFQKKKFSGIKFFTENHLQMQIGLMSHGKNHIIKPHIHKNHRKTIRNMSEFLIIFKGILIVFFYKKNRIRVLTKTLKAKDMILFLSGGHGFKVIKKIEMLEVKQGPFNGDKDKIKFEKM